MSTLLPPVGYTLTFIYFSSWSSLARKEKLRDGETKSNKAQIKTKNKITVVKASTDNNTSL